MLVARMSNTTRWEQPGDGADLERVRRVTELLKSMEPGAVVRVSPIPHLYIEYRLVDVVDEKGYL